MPALNPQRQAVNDEFNLIVGTNIRNFRTRKGKTLAEVAEAADMDLTVLYRIEMAERSIKLREATCIALYLGTNVETLYKKQRGVIYTWT